MPEFAAGPMPLKAPSEVPSAKVSASGPIVGDGGLTWWTKALDRCKEMAKDSGKSIDEVAAERYGVFKKVYHLNLMIFLSKIFF